MRELFKKIIVASITLEAKLVLKKYKPRIIAITGSVGKTSTKDAVFSILKDHAHIRKSQKSFNSELGLPLTILGCPNAWNNPFRWLQNILDGLFLLLFRAQYPEWLVLEVGADRPGDIQSLARWLPVDIAVITRLPEVPVHVEFFDSPEAVVEEKASIIRAVKPDGSLILYADDARLDDMRARGEARGLHILTFGFSSAADVRATVSDIVIDSAGAPVGMRTHITVGNASATVTTHGTVGIHAHFSILAALAVGRVLGISLESMIQAAEHHETPLGRMRLLPGVKETTIIDDTYNSSPAAVVAALDTLALMRPRGRRIAVLGDMLELGRHSVDEHRKIGAHAAKTADILMTVGFRARDMAESALDSGMRDSAILQYEDTEKVGDELEAMIQKGDCVLIKGSQSMRMERVVEHLMQEPERAGELLVRQEREWKRR